jgi:hypothetical protein
MRRVRLLDEAANEAIEAAAWYESQRAGLGADFARAVDAALDLLEEEIVPLHCDSRTPWQSRQTSHAQAISVRRGRD